MKRKDRSDNGHDVPFEVNLNRTGISLAIDRAKEMYNDSQQAEPTQGDDSGIHEMRMSYQKGAALLGSRPLPRTTKERASPPGHAVLLDKLGERLTFERRGVRLYDAVLYRWQETPGLPQSALEELHVIREEELEHFLMLQHVIIELGGDPTQVTPSADVVQVMSRGIRDIVVDPRTTPAHWLQALLTAELTDTDGWLLLCNMTAGLGLDSYVERFRQAQEAEEHHVKVVRGLLDGLMRQESQESI